MSSASPAHQDGKYRPDIDGLRALAIVPVVLYHFDIGLFRGGFVGVDVFFVISGFLIGGIVNEEVRQGRFSIWNFYRRRAIRIFPALMVMLGLTTAAAWAFLLSPELRSYGQSLGAAAGFGSNLYFWRTADYFAGDAIEKPLLHTWSLAVEEQYYLFFPAAVLLAYKHLRTRLVPVLLLTLVLSLVCSIVFIKKAPDAVFYLLPFRAWELLAGVVVAICPPVTSISLRLRTAIASLGLACVVVPMVAYDHATVFPGLAAVPPCLGASLLIWCARSTGVGALLSTPPLTFIGKISYSLYLYHWPVIVFASHSNGSTGAGRTAVLVGVSVLLAAGSWWWIEQPSRRWLVGLKVEPRDLVLTSSLAMAVVVALSFVLQLDAVVKGRFSPSVERIAAMTEYTGSNDYKSQFRLGTCFYNWKNFPGRFDEAACLNRSESKPNILIAGDSHAAQLWSGFDHVYPDVSFQQVTITGCRPMRVALDGSTCAAYFRDLFADLSALKQYDAVIVAGRWRPEDVEGVADTLRLLRANGILVALVGPVPEYDRGLPILLARASASGPENLASEHMVEGRFEVDRSMNAMAAKLDVPYLSPIDELCEGRVCQELTGVDEPIQFDYGHLTKKGAIVLVERFQKDARVRAFLDQVQQRRQSPQ